MALISQFKVEDVKARYGDLIKEMATDPDVRAIVNRAVENALIGNLNAAGIRPGARVKFETKSGEFAYGIVIKKNAKSIQVDGAGRWQWTSWRVPPSLLMLATDAESAEFVNKEQTLVVRDFVGGTR